jgi:hypothetical protein
VRVTRRNVDAVDAEIAERARSKRYFDLCEERLDYEPLRDVRKAPIYFQLSKTSLEMAARDIGPSFVYQLYVHSSRLFQARNIVYAIVAHVKSNPFAPYINIIENTAFDAGEWVLEANEKRYGSAP